MEENLSIVKFINVYDRKKVAYNANNNELNWKKSGRVNGRNWF